MIIKPGLLNPIHFLLFLIITLALPGYSIAEETVKLTTVEVDLNAGVFLSHLPFDAPFLIKGTVTKEVKKITCQFKKKNTDPWTEISQWINRVEIEEKPKEFYLICDKYLEAGHEYEFLFTYESKLTEDKIIDIKEKLFTAIDEIWQDFNQENMSHFVSDIQKVLIQTLKRFETDNRIILKYSQSSILDGNGREKFDRFLDSVANVQTLMEMEEKRKDIINKFYDELGQKSEEFSTIYYENPFLQAWQKQLKSKIDQETAKKKDMSEEMGMKKLIDQLLDLDMDKAEKILSGTGELTADQAWKMGTDLVPLEDCRSAEDVRKRSGNLQNTLFSVQKISRFMKEAKNETETEIPEKLIQRLNEVEANLKKRYQLLENISYILEDRLRSLVKLVDEISIKIREEIIVLGSTSADFKTRTRWYISADIGLAYVFTTREFMPYYGVNIYLRPINRNTPLKCLKDIPYMNGLERFMYRFSILVAFTKDSVAVDGEREDLFPNKSLLVGAGFRLTELIKLNAGMMLFRDSPAGQTPMAKKEPAKADFFMALSVDWNIEATVGKILGLFLGK